MVPEQDSVDWQCQPFLYRWQKLLRIKLPPVDASDLESHLVLQTRYITAKQLKVHKSSEAYSQITGGWVKYVKAYHVANKYVITGKVRKSSQKLCCAQKLYCCCRKAGDGVEEMIGCDQAECSLEWFYITCLKIKKNIPEWKCYCPTCFKLPQLSRKGK